jgi:hypothetical protein
MTETIVAVGTVASNVTLGMAEMLAYVFKTYPLVVIIAVTFYLGYKYGK